MNSLACADAADCREVQVLPGVMLGLMVRSCQSRAPVNGHIPSGCEAEVWPDWCMWVVLPLACSTNTEPGQSQSRDWLSKNAPQQLQARVKYMCQHM